MIPQENLLLDDINTLYRDAELRLESTLRALRQLGCPLSHGWYNGHYRKGAGGAWQRESFPIPVIHVEGLCEVELPFESIAVTARLTRASALTYRFDRLADYDYELLSAEDMQTEYYHRGMSDSERQTRLEASHEPQLLITVHLPPDVSDGELVRLIGILLQDGFFNGEPQ